MTVSSTDNRITAKWRGRACRFLAAAVTILAAFIPSSAHASDTLGPNEQLGPNEYLQSSNGRYRFTNQGDGNLVLTVEGYAVWSTGGHNAPGILTMQGDGNLVYLSMGGDLWWNSQTPGHDGQGVSLVMQDDGNAVANTAAGQYVWDTRTNGTSPPGYWLGPGGALNAGEWRNSPSGEYSLQNQISDGNLVLYRSGCAVWSTGMGALGWAAVEDDGRLWLHRQDGSNWISDNSSGGSGAHLEVRDSGDLVVVGADNSIYWQAPLTSCAPPPSPTLTTDTTEVRPSHPLEVHVAGAPGDAIVGLTWSGASGGLIDSKPVNGAPSVTFSSMPASGSVQAIVYNSYDGEGNPVPMASSPLVNIVRPSLSVNNVATGGQLYITTGTQFTVAVHSVGAEIGDRVGLFHLGDPDSAAVQMLYMDESTQIPPSRIVDASLTFTAPPTPGGPYDAGFYDVRMFDGATGAKLVTWATVNVEPVPATLTINGQATGFLTLPASMPFNVVVTNAPNMPGGLISIYPSGLCCDFAFSGETHVFGPGNSTVTFRAPDGPSITGSYTIHLVDGIGRPESGYTPILLASSPDFAVRLPSLTINGQGAGPDDILFRPNTPVTVDVHDAPDGGDHVAWFRLSDGVKVLDQSINGDLNAHVTFTAPETPEGGRYHVRLLAAPDGSVRASGPDVYVPRYKLWLRSDAMASPVLSDITADPGATVHVLVGAEGHADNDKLQLFTASGSALSQVVLLTGPPTTSISAVPAYEGTFTVPTTGGPWVVRFFDGATGIQIGTSDRIYVSGTPTPTTLTVNGQGESGSVQITTTSFTAHVSFAPSSPADQVRLYWRGETNDDNFIDFKYLANNSQTPPPNGVPYGDVTFSTDNLSTQLLQGHVEVRFFTLEPPNYTNLIRTAVGPAITVAHIPDSNNGVTITVNGYTVSEGPVHVTAGQSLQIAVTGEAIYHTDVLVIRKAGTKEDAVPEHPLTVDGEQSFTITGPTTPGSYEVLLFAAPPPYPTLVAPPPKALGPLLQVAGTPFTGTDTTYYYDVDAIGSVRQITVEDGAVVAQKDYLPFGTDWHSTSTQFGDRVLFGGKERDFETGLDYFGTRYFSKDLGRFMVSDSMLNVSAALKRPQLWNRYVYVTNNPLRKVDPDGRWEKDVHYELTRVLARAVGFSPDAARAIAEADQGVDENPLTQPLGPPWGEAVERRTKYHFTTTERRDEMWALFGVDSSYDSLGQFMHAEQDSFSHAGYGPTRGQADFALTLQNPHLPDITAVRPNVADAMARDSYVWLTRANGDTANIPWSVVEPYVTRFNRALPNQKGVVLNELEKLIDYYRYP